MTYVSIFYQKEKKSKFSIWHFRIFYDKKKRKSKIGINFQFLILNENWMDEWHTGLPNWNKNKNKAKQNKTNTKQKPIKRKLISFFCLILYTKQKTMIRKLISFFVFSF